MIFFPVEEGDGEGESEPSGISHRSHWLRPVTIKQRERERWRAVICDLPYTRPVCVPYSSVYTELTRCFTDHHSGEGSDTLWRSPRPDFNSPDADERDADWNSAYIKCNILTCSPRLRSRNHGKVASLFLNVSLRCRIAMSVFSWEDHK